jgi:hypothetical protein
VALRKKSTVRGVRDGRLLMVRKSYPPAVSFAGPLTDDRISGVSNVSFWLDHSLRACGLGRLTFE